MCRVSGMTHTAVSSTRVGHAAVSIEPHTGRPGDAHARSKALWWSAPVCLCSEQVQGTCSRRPEITHGTKVYGFRSHHPLRRPAQAGSRWPGKPPRPWPMAGSRQELVLRPQRHRATCVVSRAGRAIVRARPSPVRRGNGTVAAFHPLRRRGPAAAPVLRARRRRRRRMPRGAGSRHPPILHSLLGVVHIVDGAGPGPL